MKHINFKLIHTPIPVLLDAASGQPPPEDNFLITESGDFLITEDGDFLIAE